MKTGMKLDALAARVKDEAERREDYIIDTRNVTMLNGSELHFDEIGQEFGLTDLGHRQLAGKCGIPVRYYDKLRDEMPDLLDLNVNRLLRHDPQDRMFRTLKADGRRDAVVRAILSDRYRKRDNMEIMQFVVPVLSEVPGASIASASITETAFYLKVLTDRIQGDIRKGDAVQAGVVIRNSEVGHGSLRVQPMVFRLVCTNGMIAPFRVGEGERHYHIGSRVTADEDYKVFSDATLELDDRAFFAKIADAAKAAFNEANFELIVGKLRDAAEGPQLEKPVKAIEKVAQKLGLSEAEEESVVDHLIEGGDITTYGVINAITRAAQDVESYDRSTEMEEMGGRILELAGTPAWARLVAA